MPSKRKKFEVAPGVAGVEIPAELPAKVGIVGMQGIEPCGEEGGPSGKLQRSAPSWRRPIAAAASHLHFCRS